MNTQDDNPGHVGASSVYSTSSVTLVEPETSRTDNYVVDHLIDFNAGVVPTPAPTEPQVGHSSFSLSAKHDVPALESDAELNDWYLRALATPKGKANAVPRPEALSHNQNSPTASTSNPYINRSLPPLPAIRDSLSGLHFQSPTGARPHYSARPHRFPDPEDSDDEGASRLSLLTTSRPLFSPALAPSLSSQQHRPTRDPLVNAYGTNSIDPALSEEQALREALVATHMEDRERRIREREERERDLLKEKERAQSNWRRFGENSSHAATSSSTAHPWSSRSPIRTPAYNPTHQPLRPWGTDETSRQHPLNPGQTNQRPDIHSRNATLTTISDLLFNFDCSSEELTSLIEDACATAKEVGVPTTELLANNVVIGNHDLGMTPLCLEASRCDLNDGIELLAWLLDNAPRGLVDRDLKRGCLMRNNGLGDQAAWSTMKLFVPEEEGQAVFAYDVAVENVFAVLGATPAPANPSKEDEPAPTQDSDDEGSLYDDISIIDAESSINQADIETLKSSDDEDDAKKDQPTDGVSQAPSPTVRVHRARIDIPLFEASLRLEDEFITPAYTALPEWSPSVPSKLMNECNSGMIRQHPGLHSGQRYMPMDNRVLTAEWMHEGRIWALSIGKNKLALTLRSVSEVVSHVRVKVKAVVRIFPATMGWDEVEELAEIAPHRLLPTAGKMMIPPVMPCYTCEFEEMEMVPGPPTLSGRSSVWKEGIHMSSLSFLDILEPSGAMKVEVMLKITEVPPEITVSEAYPPEVSKEGGSTNQEQKASGSVSGEFDDWQQVEF
ncbi:hypothetical protein BDV93DRAFT_525772 [Ceratobasidium sp. AG-I]|nr:hypothetical protein BDV93DRAFT_525772 [Ceratobasidium sp. AG-I]